VHFSFDHDVKNPPSVQIRQMSQFNRGIEPLDFDLVEGVLRMSFASACRLIDSEYCSPGILRTLAHHLHCQPAYLARIHAEHRRNVLHVSDAKVAKIAKARAEESKAHVKQTHEGRMRQGRVRDDNGPGWFLSPDTDTI
jgi:AraC-like DNA-binding protein